MKILILNLLALLVVMPATAQDTISLDEYRFRVLDYSYTLKQAAQQTSAARQTVQGAYTGFLPQLSASGDFSVNFRTRYSSGQMLKPYSFTLQPAIVQQVYSGGSVRNIYQQSQVSYDIARLQEELSALDVCYLAEYNYWNLASNEALLGVTRRYEQIVRDMFDVIEVRFADGYVAKTDLLMIQTRLKEAEFNRVQAESYYRVSLHNFNILMGIQTEHLWVATDSINRAVVPPRQVDPRQVIEEHPQYQISQRQIDFQQYNVKLAAAPYNPQLSVGVQGLWNAVKPNFRGQTELDGVAFLRLSVPIFHWGERRHAVEASKATLRSTEYARSNVADNLNVEIANAWSNFTTAAVQISVAQANLSVAQENLSINTFSYNEGQLSILDVISAQLSWLQAYTNTITAYFNEKVAISAYKKAANL